MLFVDEWNLTLIVQVYALLRRFIIIQRDAFTCVCVCWIRHARTTGENGKN